MKKLALILFGISYSEYIHWDSLKYGKLFINFKYSHQNYKDYIYSYFENLGYSIDTYISTNNIYN